MYSRRTSSSSPMRWIAGLFIIGIAIAAFVLFQSWRQDTTSGPVPTAVPSANAAVNATAAPAATARPIEYQIVSDKAQLSAAITELYYAVDADNWDLTYLGALAGHLQGTPVMGQGGNFVLAGHVELKDGSRGPFASIHLLAPGDPITIIGNTQPSPTLRQYVVTATNKVQPLDFGVMRNHGYEELTLITCDNWDDKTKQYLTRVIVHARPAASIARLTATAAASQTARARIPLTPTRKK